MPESIDIQKAMRNLCEVNLFCELDSGQLEQVAAICHLVQVEQGHTLIIEGDDADCVFILLQGEVHISRQLNLPNISNIHGTDRILTKITADKTPLIGETALLGIARRQSSVRCATDCIMYRINASELLELVNADAGIGRIVYRQLAELLHSRLDSTSIDVVKLSAALVLALEE